MTKTSLESKIVAKAAAAAFGTAPSVDRYWDDHRKASVDIVSCLDSPCRGVTSYATVGVSCVALVKDGRNLGVRTELVGACGSRFAEFPNCLSTAAFCVINSGWLVAPGIIFPSVVAMYRPASPMKHFLFLPPFPWDGRLRTIAVGESQVAWLLAVPISDGEMRFAESTGVSALEELCERRQVDIFNLDRASVV